MVLPPEGIALDSTGKANRVYLRDTLILLASVGGTSDQDTSLLEPYFIVASGDRAFLVEADQRVLAYDTLGKRLWSAGRNGSGPGEFRNIRDIKAAPNGEVWLNDPSNARITRLTRDGQVAGYISTEHVGHSEAMVPGDPGRAILLPPYADADILTINAEGAVTGRDSVPWAGYHELENLARTFHTANDPGIPDRWAMGFMYGNGWLAFNGNRGSKRHYYIEPTQFPAVVKEVSNGGATISSRLVRGDLSAMTISLSGDTVYALFGGTDRFLEKLDLYSWSSGNYLGSIALPEAADVTAVSGSFIYALNSQPTPRLTIYRRVARR